jgi:hypothetical protein
MRTDRACPRMAGADPDGSGSHQSERRTRSPGWGGAAPAKRLQWRSSYWAQAQALDPESAQICAATSLCRCGEALCGEPLPP